MISTQPALEIDLERLRIRRGDTQIQLTRTEWDLLRVLVQHKNQTLSHTFLLKAIWGEAYGTESSYLYVYIKRLRQKLGIREGDPQHLLTLPKLGYQWVEQENPGTATGAPSAGKPGVFSMLPTSLTSFIGRERELRLLDSMLRKPNVRLITLTGPGGIGKTRLALEIANRLARERVFADGIHFIGLETVDSADFVVSAIARIFGIREKAGEELLNTLKEHLREKHLLLILDNFEHVHAARDQVLDILKSASGLKTLVTTRARLDLYGEHNFEVPPLSLDSTEEDGLPLSEAIQLFAERAQAAQPYFEITPENADAVRQICDRLDGLPLAIELAAVQSRRFTPDELLKRLESRLAVLIDGQSNLPTRYKTLLAAIDWSYRLLDAHERRLFVSLSVFNGSFSLAAVEAVYARDSQQKERVAKKLLSLQNKSLLTAQWSESGNETRYTLLGAFREYAAQQLDRREAEELGRRHADYFVRLLEQAAYNSGDFGYERLALDLDNLRAALLWAITTGAGELSLQLGVGMHELWLRLGILREGRQRLLEVLAATETDVSALRARALYCAGVFSDWLGEPHAAQGLYRESLRLYESLGDPAGIASALLTLASALVNQGDYGEGRILSEQALNMAREGNNTFGVALALNNLGMVAIYQGEVRKARGFYEEMQSLWQSLGSVQGMGWSYTGLGWASLLQGDYESAQDFIDRSLTYHQQAADMLGATLAMTCDSWIALHQADFAVAAEKLSRCLTMCQELGLINLSVWPLVGLGLIDLQQGHIAQAERLFEEAHDICKQLNYPPMTTWIYVALGRLSRMCGKMEAAFDYLDRGFTLSRKRDDRSALITTIEEFAAYFAVQNAPEKSIQLYGAADSMREQYQLPLPKLDHLQHDGINALLKSTGIVDRELLRQKGAALTWNEIMQLIYE